MAVPKTSALMEKLVRFVTGVHCSSPDEAQQLTRDATQSRTDVLTFIAHRFPISEEEVYARAASFCRLPFSAAIPREPEGAKKLPPPRNLDRLAHQRYLASQVLDRHVHFVSPTADECLALGARRATGKDLLPDICVVPPRVLRQNLAERHSGALIDNARQWLATRWPAASAHLELGMVTRAGFVVLAATLVAAAAFAPFGMVALSGLILLLVFLPNACLRIAALLLPYSMEKPRRLQLLGDRDLPIYTILLPLRDETGMVAQLVRAMRALDYPPEKLDIKFVVESTSTATVAAVRRHLDDPRFELIEVPDVLPHTKPKALNYALPFARGAHIVIYDAEDIPEPDQPRRAATAFALNPEIDCFQAELAADNADENWLTALFAAEYSGLFGIMLPALARWGFPVPLGGTSNHFRLSALKEVRGWDAFNVTEDADLGVRLARLRYNVETLPSRTYEEAPISLRGWMAQRTRWMKGWMQTFIVHNRHPSSLLGDLGWRGFIAFQFYVGGLILSAPLHLVFLVALALRLATRGDTGLDTHSPEGLLHIGVLVAGYSATMLHSVIGAIRLKRRHLVWVQLLLPLYWALIGIAAFRAAGELLTRPYFWAKTQHGLTRKIRGSSQTVMTPGYRPLQQHGQQG